MKYTIEIETTKSPDELQKMLNRLMQRENNSHYRSWGWTPPIQSINIKPAVTNPDGYKEFGKAVTKLSPKELEDLFKGHKED
jgi:hypothetical protein